MPSGKKILWEACDHLIVAHLPTMTIANFAKTHLPEISQKAIGSRARKLGIKPADYKPTDEHKQKIAYAVSKIDSSGIDTIRRLRDTHSVNQIAKILNVDELTIHRAIAKHVIEISDVGRERAKEASRIACLGREPWNKGGQLTEETKAKISAAVSGEKNGQYGRGMTENEKEKWRESFFKHGLYSLREWIRKSNHLLKTTAATQTPEFRKSQSELISSMILDGRLCTKTRGISTHLVTTKGGEFTTRSSYETRFVAKLESDPDVVSFIYEPLRIPYEFDGVELWYIPDFLVVYRDHEELVEVKPLAMIGIDKNVAKFKAGQSFHVGFRVVTEDDL